MRVAQIQDEFGLENLQVVERLEPSAGPGEVKLRMKAASINYRDWMMVNGTYNPSQPLPLIPCSDGVGEVVDVGEGVERVDVGERVATTFFENWVAGEPTYERLKTARGGPIDGSLAELVVTSSDAVVHVPEHLSDAEAATLPCAAVTAWSALVTQGDVTAGDTILVQGTGGVSIFALQIGKMLGARVIATSSSDEKLELARKLGADETINYVDDPDWGKTAKRLTDQGVDHVIEVGGAGTLQQSLKAVRPGGHISVIGVLTGVKQELNIIPVLMRNIRLQGVIVGHRESFEAMNRAIAHHGMKPVVDRTFELDDVRDAFQYLADGRHVGKVCVRL